MHRPPVLYPITKIVERIGYEPAPSFPFHASTKISGTYAMCFVRASRFKIIFLKERYMSFYETCVHNFFNVLLVLKSTVSCSFLKLIYIRFDASALLSKTHTRSRMRETWINVLLLVVRLPLKSQQ
jgi:hypothetical protein